MLLFVDVEHSEHRLDIWYPRPGETAAQLKARAQAEQAEGKRRGPRSNRWAAQRSPYGSGTEGGATGKKRKRWGV